MELTQPASLLKLAASLGSTVAIARLSNSDRQSLDDGIRLFMSTADFLPNGFEYGPATLWPYTHEAALRMGLAAFREFLPDWRAAFQEHGDMIPDNVAPEFPSKVLQAIEGWLREPQSFDWDQHGELYCLIKDETCLDGYLPNDFPGVPKIVSAWCLGSLKLIDASN
ncbi:hypothetical protein ETAA8_58430 [Anatilimnocola aggregata]|uniref:Uncharacterized protein n=1 Tax=Anatilimnocola aggregata TaxID=2528021 RepID=A0A517YKE5_9BACT|nr:hypothetical protein [Anatilimnocola aggregata]QDU30695.1 hypothetical protein ETAA8_58430 [Anatilimnocola aggregata]